MREKTGKGFRRSGSLRFERMRWGREPLSVAVIISPRLCSNVCSNIGQNIHQKNVAQSYVSLSRRGSQVFWQNLYVSLKKGGENHGGNFWGGGDRCGCRGGLDQRLSERVGSEGLWGERRLVRNPPLCDRYFCWSVFSSNVGILILLILLLAFPGHRQHGRIGLVSYLLFSFFFHPESC